MKKLILLTLPIVLLLTGCDALFPKEVVEETPDPEPVSVNKLIAKREIRSGSTIADDHLANIEIWMYATPRKPAIVFTAVKDIEYFLISIALPVCYIFPRERGQQPSWQGNQLKAGESVEIISRWEQVSDDCDDDFATFLWNLSSQYEGSKSSISVPWKWPEDDVVTGLLTP